MAIECAFCPKPAVIKGGEHVFSDWMNPIVQGMFPGKQINLQMWTDTGKTANWKSVSLNMKMPVVCKKCNNGWMSILESQHAKPAMKDLIVKDKLVSISPASLKSIAAFAFKHSVVADYMSFPKREPFFSLAARRSFAASLTVPQGVYMWLAAFKERRQGLFVPLYYDKIQASTQYAQSTFDIYAFTFGLGYFLFQVLGFRWASSGFSVPPRLNQDATWNKYSIPFFPIDGQAIIWPSDKQLTWDTARDFVNRGINLR